MGSVGAGGALGDELEDVGERQVAEVHLGARGAEDAAQLRRHRVHHREQVLVLRQHESRADASQLEEREEALAAAQGVGWVGGAGWRRLDSCVHTCSITPFGSPVEPDVYMSTHSDEGFGGVGAHGLALPIAMTCAKERTCVPRSRDRALSVRARRPHATRHGGRAGLGGGRGAGGP